jgi:hypothetical protein
MHFPAPLTRTSFIKANSSSENGPCSIGPSAFAAPGSSMEICWRSVTGREEPRGVEGGNCEGRRASDEVCIPTQALKVYPLVRHGVTRV